MKPRALLLSVVLLLLSVPLTSAQPVTLEFWYGEAGDIFTSAMDEIVRQFNASQNDIRVEIVHRGNSNAFEESFLVASASETPPDVVYLNSTFIRQWSLAGNQFLPLNGLIPSGELESMQWIPAMQQDLFDGQTWYGFPFRAAGRGLFTNRAHLAEAGLPPQEGPERIADLDEWAAKLTRFAADGSVERLGFAPSGNNFLQGLAWLWVFGGDYYDAERRRPRFAADPAHLAALEWIQGYAQRYGATAASSAGNFRNGRASMHINTTSALAEWPTNNPDLDFWVQKIPRYDELDATTFIGGQGVAIARGTRHPEAAARFLHYLASTEVQVQWYRRVGTIPARLEAVRMIGDDVNDPRELAILDMLPTAHARDPLFRVVTDQFNDLLNRMRQQEITPSEVLATMDRQATPEYEAVFP